MLAKLQKTNQTVRGDKVADGGSWIKISVDIFNNKKIKQIRSLPDGDSIIGIWLQILCLAGSINENGAVYFTKDLPYTEDMLAVEFDRPLNTMKLAIKTFISFGMIEITDNVMCVTNWLKYQNGDGLDKIREQARIRQQKYRQRLTENKENNREELKESTNVTLRNVTERDEVTLPSISVSNILVSSSKSKVLSTKEKKESLKTVIEEYTDNEELIESIAGFIEMRKKMKKELTVRALKIVLNKLEPFSDKEKIMFLDKSVVNNWISVYTESKEQYQKPTQKQTVTSKLMDMIRRGENDDTGNSESVIDADYFIPKF